MSDLGNNVALEYSIDLSDPPLVEIGQVRYNLFN